MPDVHHITAQVRPPNDDDPGQVTDGYYVIEDDMLTMTDAEGAPIHRDDGTPFSCKLAPQSDARIIGGVAAQLTRKVRRSLLGLSETEEKFRRPLQYGRSGLA